MKSTVKLLKKVSKRIAKIHKEMDYIQLKAKNNYEMGVILEKERDFLLKPIEHRISEIEHLSELVKSDIDSMERAISLIDEMSEEERKTYYSQA